MRHIFFLLFYGFCAHSNSDRLAPQLRIASLRICGVQVQGSTYIFLNLKTPAPPPNILKVAPLVSSEIVYVYVEDLWYRPHATSHLEINMKNESSWM